MLSLPPEILLEITDYFHNTPIPFERYRQDPTPILLGRFETLRSLSQTCSYLRYVFRPLVWEAMEVLDTPSDVTGRHINLLKRWMTGILKTPDLLPCVRIVLVSLRLSSPNWNFISLFTRFLHSTPNLAALHIIEIFDRHAGPLAVRLAKRPFPAVQTLTIPSSLSRVLCSFPNLRTLVCADTFISDYDAGNLLKQAHKHCHELDSLSNFTPSNSIIQGIVDNFPFVKSLIFRHVLCAEDLAQMQGRLINLHFIQFPYRHLYRSGEKVEHVRAAAESIISAGKKNALLITHVEPPHTEIGDLVVGARLASP